MVAQQSDFTRLFDEVGIKEVPLEEMYRELSPRGVRNSEKCNPGRCKFGSSSFGRIAVLYQPLFEAWVHEMRGTLVVCVSKKGQGRRDASPRPKTRIHRTPSPRIVRRVNPPRFHYRITGALIPCSLSTAKYFCGSAAIFFAQPGQQM